MKVTRDGDALYADIHGLRVEQARRRLLELIETAPAEVKYLVVIHGYHTGEALKTMVRGTLAAPRIKRIVPAYNAGQTVVHLRKK